MTDLRTGLSGLRILVVEDEAIIAMHIEDMLQDLKCEPVGPASTIERALDIIRSDDRLDGVLLDMNLRGITVLPIAEELLRKGVAFVLVTGYARRDDEAPALRNAPRLSKPFTMVTLSEALADAFMHLT
jgi:CheY-like chemotaxis protein